MSKPNHSAKKAEVINMLIRVFEQSGEEFTCLAVFINRVRPHAEILAKESIAQGYSFSKSQYFPWASTRDNFAMWAAKEYQKRNFG